MKKIAFIGGGSMSEAMVSGIIAQGLVDRSQIFITNRSDQDRLSYLSNLYGITASANLEKTIKGADIVVLAVKPKDVAAAMTAAGSYLKEGMLVVSVAAGVDLNSLETLAGKKLPIIRAMPNTSAAVGKSATAVAVNKYADKSHLEKAREMFETIGLVAVVEEEQLNAVTGLSGSGPAYIYYLVEAMEQSAEEIGLEKETAKQLIIQTIIGAADMLSQSPKTPAALRREVTSPGGTTEAGIKVLENHNVKEALVSCIVKATEQANKLGNQLKGEIQAAKSKVKEISH
ncbi:pyrroline-5-carboxylate reductase [Peribacillus saganii]|uniref:Pyrroline-5-carboxylate reductase n=1 Tax=Peribacillus saganii TaxID=2303992 RepID=A0A372L9L2_9BACI|nr:pyrroline-5-carboxylate reductase [Peribacillus saganii]RFU62310.1 pyrroline-5-carboxylate reductase [Peribacillus saganii]